MSNEWSLSHPVDASVVGCIDVLAIDSKGHYVVIEIKAGTVEDSAVGQLLGYMGWYHLYWPKENLSEV